MEQYIGLDVTIKRDGDLDPARRQKGLARQVRLRPIVIT